MHDFEAGDIVQLKSGGPLMTVYATPLNLAGVGVQCLWFAEGYIRRDTIEIIALEHPLLSTINYLKP